MDTKEIKNIINQYFDNELSKAEEVILFTELSQNVVGREFFKEMNNLRNITENTYDDFPSKLDEKILSGISKQESDKPFFYDRSKLFSAASYVVALILLVISIFLFNESAHYKKNVELVYRQVNQQNRMINVLINSLPQTEVRAEFANEIIVTPQL